MIVVSDIAYVRYRAPDLDVMEQFLLDFGLHRLQRTPTHLYMRAAGAEPYVHVTELGERASLGMGLLAQSEDDLQRVAEKFGTSVRNNPEPRGGRIVTVADPDGLQLDVLYGGMRVEPMPVRASLKVNAVDERRRHGATQRLSVQPSAVMRLGHAVLKVRNYRESYDFYTQLFGFKCSDSFYDGAPNQPVVAFLHCGLGQLYTDHHTVAIVQIAGVGFEHTAFEVIDWDDVATGHQHLRNKGHYHSWGIGRHVEGSQIFDYWRDPFGNKIEHWTDGDLVNEDYVGSQSQLDPAGMAQWSPPMSTDFLA